MQTEHYMANMDRPGRGLDAADDGVAPDGAPPARSVPSIEADLRGSGHSKELTMNCAAWVT
jgi:hypothetical protein